MCLPLNSEIKLTDIVSVRQHMKSVHLFNYNTDVSKLVRYIALIIAWPVIYVKFSLLKRKLKLINTSHARYFFFIFIIAFFLYCNFEIDTKDLYLLLFIANRLLR